MSQMGKKSLDGKEKELEAMRHTAEHVLEQAMVRLYPGLKMAMGPATDEGFYFDFDYEGKNSEEDFAKIEAEMKKLIKADLPLRREELDIGRARKLFGDNEYKQEWLDEIEERGEKATVYWTGKEFVDLCAGPHVASTGKIGAFKLLSVAGAYWRGDEKNKMLTRIYGTAFATEKELDEYLEKLEETKKRDHRKLGKTLEIFMFSDLVGPGLPLYMPKGAVVVGEIENFMRQLQTQMGYEHVYTPHLAKQDLFQTSGHLQWFAEGMYPPMEFPGEGKYYAKPMNCPFHIEIYKSKTRSYRDLPLRYAEFGTVYRYEKSGEISGLVRTRGFTQDDAHIFCREEQVVDEFRGVFEFTDKLLSGLGLSDHWHRLSLRGEEKKKYAGNEKQWQRATELIREALKQSHISYKETPGEAAFYGPKLDIIFKDSLGREMQISTIQVDFLLPERFGLAFVDENGEEKRPYMIHRAPLGSRERVMSLLLEHYGGAFPVWLAPLQVKVIPITDKQSGYGREAEKALLAAGIRVELDGRSETMQAKIRQAQMEKVPYMLVVGKKEMKNKTVAVRTREGEDKGEVKLVNFVQEIKREIETKQVKLA